MSLEFRWRPEAVAGLVAGWMMILALSAGVDIGSRRLLGSSKLLPEDLKEPVRWARHPSKETLTEPVVWPRLGSRVKELAAMEDLTPAEEQELRAALATDLNRAMEDPTLFTARQASQLLSLPPESPGSAATDPERAAAEAWIGSADPVRRNRLLLSLAIPAVVPRAHHRFEVTAETARFLRMWLTTAWWHAGTLALAAIFVRQHRMSFRDFLGIRRTGRMGWALIGVAAGLIAFPAGLLVSSLCARLVEVLDGTPRVQTAVEILVGLKHGWQLALFGFTAVVSAPLVEEILFRGVLYPFFKHLGRPRWAMFGTSLAFGIIHFNWVALLPLVLLAVALVHLYEWSDSLMVPILAHCTFNAANLAFSLLLPIRGGT